MVTRRPPKSPSAARGSGPAFSAPRCCAHLMALGPTDGRLSALASVSVSPSAPAAAELCGLGKSRAFGNRNQAAVLEAVGQRVPTGDLVHLLAFQQDYTASLLLAQSLILYFRKFFS